jgi:hypothetical protein
MTTKPRTETVVGSFNRILESDSPWAQAGFELPGGQYWEYKEPDAMVLVKNGWLQVSAVPYTRGNDHVQILDNAKHMYFSKERFEVPEGGRITFEIQIAARPLYRPGEMFDGYVSGTCSTSDRLGVDFFASGETVTTVYARLPSRRRPATPAAKAFCVFNGSATCPPARPGPPTASRMTKALTPSGSKPTAASSTIRARARQDHRLHRRPRPHVRNRHRRRQVRDCRPGRHRALGPMRVVPRDGVQITVVGAGVAGLTSAVALQRASHDVRVVAAGPAWSRPPAS